MLVRKLGKEYKRIVEPTGGATTVVHILLMNINIHEVDENNISTIR